MSALGAGLAGRRFVWTGGLLVVIAMALLWATHADAKATPAEIEVYAENFDVPKAVAAERLTAQTKGAEADIVGELEEGLGGDFAGLWFDHETGEFVVPMATADRSQAAGKSREAAVTRELSAISLAGDYRTRVVQSSWSELEAAQARIDERLSGFFEENVVQKTSLDPRVNAVVVSVRAGAPKAKLKAIEGLVKNADVNVDFREVGAKAFELGPLACETGEEPLLCSLPMRGGVRIWGDIPGTNESEVCTAAFRANGYDGKRYILTAGHCIYPSNPALEWNTEWGGYLQSVGTASQWHWPGKDWAKIDATGSWADTPPWPTLIAAWDEPVYGPNYEYPITGEASSYMQELVCHSGATSGTSCGQVTGLNVSTEYGSIKINSMTEVKGYELCNEDGDSGGPWFPLAAHTALGINSGGYEGCDGEFNAGSYYNEIKDATAELGVNIAGPGAPEATTGSTSGYPLHQATVTGTVDPNGVTSNYHFEFGTSPGSYTGSSSPYGAGSGTEPVAANGTLDNLKGNTTYYFRVVAQNSIGTDYGDEKVLTTPAWKPIVTPQAPTEVKAGHGKLNAQVNPQGSETYYHFEVGTKSGEYEYAVPYPAESIGSGTSNVAVSQEITGLKGLTTYYWRVVSSNEDGQTISPEQSFTTPDWRPVVTTEKQTGVKVLEEQGQATLHGKVNPKGFATTYRFEWGTQAEFEAEEYGHSVPVPDGEAGSGEADVSVEATAKGLKGQTTYHFRLVAENVEGESPNPQDKSFTTPDWRPSVLHRAAVGIGAESATLTARVNPRGFATTYQIEWGTQAEYEEGEYNNTIEGGPVGSGQVEVEVEEPLEGLKPRRAYHFRVIAENAEGAHTPLDVPFKTSTAGIEASSYPVSLEATPATQFSELFVGISVSCTGPTLQGELQAGAQSVALTSTEAMSCENIFGSFEWEMNGCGFEFDPGYGDLTESEGELNIGPPGCGPIVTDVGNCEVEIPPQIGRPATFINEGEGAAGKIKVSVGTSDLRYSPVSGIDCFGPDDAADGGLWGTWEVSAKEAGVKVTPAFEVGPEVQTEGATEIGRNDATVHGTLDTLGIAGAWGVEYGLEAGEEYESLASGGIVKAGIEGPQEKQLALTDLLPGHTYHYRLVAGTVGGNSKGEDRTFTTTAAHPARFTATGYPATLTGANEVAVDFESQAAGLQVQCEAVGLEGSLASAGAELALSPSFEGGKACGGSFEGEEAQTTVDPNSCQLALGLASTGPPHHGALSLSCAEEGDAIELLVLGIIELQLGPQSAAGSLAYESQGSGSAATVSAQGSGSGLAWSCAPAFYCELGGIPTSGEDGVLEIDTELEGADAEEGPAGLSIEEPSEVGLFMAGEEGAEGDEPRIEAGEYPATLSGANEAEVLFEVEGSETQFKCEAAALSGTLGAAGTAPALAPAFEGCQMHEPEGSEVASIDPSSCSLVLGIDSSGPPYGGALAVSCKEEGDAIELGIPGVITLAVGAQGAAGSLAYENQGSGAAATVSAQGSGTGVAYTCQPAFVCGLAGIPTSGEDGVLGLDAELSGVRG